MFEPMEGAANTPSYVSSRVRVLVAFAVGACAGIALLLAGQGRLAPLVTWDVAASVFLIWIWAKVWPMGREETAAHACREDPGRLVADSLLLTASVVSLAAVGVVLIKAGDSSGSTRDLLIALGVVSVVIGWLVVHTVYTLRYADLYYDGTPGGVDFNEDGPPVYVDFAYLAFTIGMTFQVSDTDLQSRAIRRAALRHALLSYLFGVVIIATTINLVAGLTTK
jgi:uncharacterized membrane protein